MLQIKCSAEPPEICARCRRLGLRCVVVDNGHHRQTKAQLRRELEGLRSGSISAAPQTGDTSSPETSRSGHLESHGGGSGSDTTNLLGLSSVGQGPDGEVAGSSPWFTNEPCLSRSIQGREVVSTTIRNCFRL
jgi:hypothetical protein